MRLAILFFTLLALASSQAQESPTPTPAPTITPSPSITPSPPPPTRNVPLRFALPPLKGTISLGIYDRSGKLVRVLHREDAVTDFTAGNDALETVWDGNNDDGNSLPNGKYSARGYVIGDLRVEGIDYFFNDWVKDEKSPHIRRLTQLWRDNGELRVDAELAGGRKTAFDFDPTTGTLLNEVAPIIGQHCHEAPALANVVDVLDCAPGKNGTTWSVDALRDGGPRQVRQLTRGHEVLRRLEYVADDPQPALIEASNTEEKIFLVEQNDLLQRFRGLALVQTTTAGAEGAVSDWKSLFDKKIIAHQDFAIEHGRPVASSPEPHNGPEELTQTLRPNPLQHDQPGKVDLAVGLDADGSYLKTSDGLPLRTISDTPNLTRTLLAPHGDKALDAFQDDGAVVEQYRVSGLDQMMAFDCGDFELK
jgi:FlgD Ig-like domain